MKGSDYCVAHDPSLAGDRKKWRKKGGEKGANREVLKAAAELQTAEEIQLFLGRIIGQVEAGEIDPKTANSLRGLCRLQLRAIEAADLERRLKRLEKMVGGSE